MDLIYIIFFFVLGACVGSFLNVVVWRLPRGEGLVTPPSHCPKCNHKLAWFDNIPVFGWIFLGGKCRYCRAPISARYPIIEAITGLLFVLYYLVLFVWQMGPCSTRPLTIQHDWPLYGLYVFTVACLLAASLIDAELFIIPQQIPILMTVMGLLVHTVIDRPTLPGSLNLSPRAAALSAGATVGLLISLLLRWRGVLKISFPEGEPLLEVDRQMMLEEEQQAKREGRQPEFDGPIPPSYTPGQIRAEMRREMYFLMPPLLLGGLFVIALMKIPSLDHAWATWMKYDWINGLLGALLGGMVGGFVVWLTRILGTLGFGRVAMGLGDVDLMFGVGAILGGSTATIAFFLAPFFGILLAIYMLITGKRRELPYGPYLSLATAFTMIFYCPIAAYLTPGLMGLVMMIRDWITPGVG
jgi:leader peptidase (prepilin peptidase)/N-methyltransferase